MRVAWQTKQEAAEMQILQKKVQELSYRKQIARQLRTQYVEGIHTPEYYTVTLKSVKGHTRSLETEPLGRSYTTYY